MKIGCHGCPLSPYKFFYTCMLNYLVLLFVVLLLVVVNGTTMPFILILVKEFSLLLDFSIRGYLLLIFILSFFSSLLFQIFLPLLLV